MTSRTSAAKLDSLVEQTASLEELAGRVQVDDEESGLAAAKRLNQDYRAWFASALTVLPDDLEESFRSEYKGSIFKHRIKHFLENPRELSAFYAPLDEETAKALNSGPWQHPFGDTFRRPLTDQKQILIEARARLGYSTEMLDGLYLLEKISRKLPVSFAVLRREVQNRPGIEVNDEYDVQRILHAFAIPFFEEVEPEEPTPKKAGASSRLDFLLRRERIAVETKMVGKNLTIQRLRKDLAEDITYFEAHPDAGCLFVLVYDPLRKITNSAGFERDLHSDSDDFPVRAVVTS